METFIPKLDLKTLQQQLRLMFAERRWKKRIHFPRRLHRLSDCSSEQKNRDSLKEASSGKVSSRDTEGTAWRWCCNRHCPRAKGCTKVFGRSCSRP